MVGSGIDSGSDPEMEEDTVGVDNGGKEWMESSRISEKKEKHRP